MSFAFLHLVSRVFPVMALVVIAAAAPAEAAQSQSETATLSGTVVDEQNAVLPGAAVMIVNQGTSRSRETTTNSEGSFTMPLLPPGRYTVTAQLAGFAPLELRDVVLDVGERRVLTLALKLGGLDEKVTVEAGASVIQTDSGAIGNSRYEVQLKNLPVDAREVQTMFSLTAGVPEGSTSTIGGTFSRTFRSAVQVLADGVQVNPLQTEAWPAIDGIGRRVDLNIPGMDTLAEVKVVSNGANAEYAMPTQAIVASKAGSNRLTGSGFEFFRSGKLAARRWEAPASEDFERHQFGGTLGGPLRRDRIFYFLGFESFRHDADQSFSARYPSTAERGGDLSALLSRVDAQGRPAPITIFDPLTGLPFANNVIPAARISPVARELLRLIPDAPPPSGSLTNFNATFTKPVYDHSEKYDARVDFNLGSSDRIFAKLTAGHLDQFSRFSGNVPGTHGFTTKNEWTHTVATNWTRVLNATTMGVVQFTFRNTPFINIPSEGDELFSVPIRDLNPKPPYAGPPAIAIGANGLGISPLFDRLLFNVSSDYSFSVDPNVTKTFGNHTIKAGASVWRGYKTRELASPPYGRFTTASDFNNPRSTSSATGDAFADFLLGYPSTTDVTIGEAGGFMRKANYAGFVQDDWQVSPRLSLYLGLRYDYFGFFEEENGRYANAHFPSGKIVVPSGSLGQVHPAYEEFRSMFATADEVGLPDTFIRPNKTDFAPRLGAAFRMSPKQVLRGNFGVYYVDITGNTFLDTTNAPPFVRRAQLTRSLMLSQGVPVNTLYTFENPTANGSAAGGAAQISTLPGYAEEYPTQRSYAWNVTLERDLGWDTGVRLSYVGNASRNVSRNVRLNACLPGPTECLSRASGTPTGRRWSAFDTNIGRSVADAAANYHGAELEVQKRFSGGMLFNANYAYAHLRADSADASDPVGNRDWDYDYGPVQTQPTHVAHWNFVYEVPVGRGRRFGANLNAVMNGLAGGWMLSGSGAWQSGQHLTIMALSGQSPTGASPNRADMIGDPARDHSGESRGQAALQWFNTAAFAQPSFLDPAATRPTRGFGTSPLGAVIGPSFARFDVAIQKVFAVGASRLQFRAEVFNPFNVPMLGNPETNIASPIFGQIRTSNLSYTPRSLQLGLRLDW